MSASRSMVIALDACDPSTVESMIGDGQLPTLGGLLRREASCVVKNPYGLYVGALWMNFATSRSPLRHGFHCWDEIDPATYEYALTPPPQDVGTTFWATASDAGRRVAVIDVPHDRVRRPINGLQLVEWGCHDRHYGFHSWPPAAASDVEAAFGLHPILGVDARIARDFAPDDYVHRVGALRTAKEEGVLFAGMLRGLDAKRRLSRSVLESGDWDLFITVFGESHATGHQQWHLHDPEHPRFDSVARGTTGGDPVREVYQRLDAAVGDLLTVADSETNVFVLLSHGMGAHYDGTHLLDEVLHRIDLVDHGVSLGHGMADKTKRLALRVPPAARQRAVTLAKPLVRSSALRGRLRAGREFVTAAERVRQRFYLEPNNYCVGGIRFNLVGREPNGCVEAGEVDRLVTSLRADLLSLVNVRTGGPVVAGVELADRWYPGRGMTRDRMPDIFVEWERSALIETVRSPKVGVVHVPYRNWRTGDHRPDGLLLALGPAVQTGSRLPDIDIEDLGPTILAGLGVPVPDDLDGKVRPCLSQTGL